ncbi:hypothetical protein NL533_33020, partial [Klebsiella pneumoniae]|nr:hypothetical protein [Klebsiella pneumoniae]
FVGNRAGWSSYGTGGVICSYGECSLTIRNCIVRDNPFTAGGWLYTDPTSTLSITFSDIDGGYSGAGNIDADPKFLRNPSPGLDGK